MKMFIVALVLSLVTSSAFAYNPDDVTSSKGTRIIEFDDRWASDDDYNQDFYIEIDGVTKKCRKVLTNTHFSKTVCD